MSELGIPVHIEESDINSDLNASILYVFGMGMYTVIYFGTMYIYFTRNPSNRRIVPAIITMLFLCNIVETGLQWYSIKWQYVNNGDTRDDIFVALLAVPSWINISVGITSSASFVLADGLLIWRCFFVWNHSFRVISIPLLLVITEIALFSVQIVFNALFTNGRFPNAAIVSRFQDVSFAAFFTTFATSLVTTVLIAYRIYSVSKQEGVSERRFKHIINMVVQSGLVYSLSLLVTAVEPVIPGGSNALNTWASALNDYSTALVNVITGISATVLVARVSMLDTTTTFPSTSVHLSGLQFHAQSTHHTDNPEGIPTGHPVGVDSNPAGEEPQVESKVQ